jgi:hypothetical protein
MVYRLALVIRIQEAPGSSLGLQIRVLVQVYRGFPQSLHANNGIVPQNMSQPFRIIQSMSHYQSELYNVNVTHI